jgi:hypothetical protein
MSSAPTRKMMLGAEQQDRLEDQLQPFAVPVLEASGEEGRKEFGPGKGLTVHLLVAADLAQLAEELPQPGAEEQHEKDVNRSPSSNIGIGLVMRPVVSGPALRLLYACPLQYP